ncbi:hypothetical protein PV326_008413 [Microctonus aethiopoides]|nr:hypothetical protein PV326_008413 [Microctonus aethiopoides]
MTEQIEYNSDDVIIIADQTSLIECLLAILRAEARHCILIDSELETNLQYYKQTSNTLTIKLQSLISLSEQLSTEKRSKIVDFIEKIQRSWEHTNKQVHDDYSTFFVASRTVYGVALTSLLNEIKKEVTAVEISLKLGEFIYDKKYIIKGYMYCSELTKLLRTLDGCDEKVQQYLMMSKIHQHIEELDMMVEKFASRKNLLSLKNDNSQVFTILSSLLSGEILGWEPVNPDIILKQNAPKKPVFITKNNKRTHLKSLQHLPLFH